MAAPSGGEWGDLANRPGRFPVSVITVARIFGCVVEPLRPKLRSATSILHRHGVSRTRADRLAEL